MRIDRSISRLAAPIALGLMTAMSGTATNAEPFENSELIVLSDGAMLATGYINGILGPREPDLLSILSQADDGTWQMGRAEVSNSVGTWPNVLAITEDGKFAVSTEPYAQPGNDARTFSDKKLGSRLTVVDLSDKNQPRVMQLVEASGPPTAVDIHPSGQVVAVTYAAHGQIALYPFDDGQLGTPSILNLDKASLGNTFVPEFKWHPSGEFAAVTLGGAAKIAFFRYQSGALEPWGAPVSTAPLPGKGYWAKNGRYFLVTTINITGDLAQLGYGQTTSLLTVVRFDDNLIPDSAPRRANDRSTTYESAPIQHSVVAVAPSGMGYVENFAVSPDENYIVGLNMVASWLPKDHPGHTNYSELTLLAFDDQTGAVSPMGKARLADVTLPQGIVFDETGQYLAITNYQGPNGGLGHVEFWSFKPQADQPFSRVGSPIPAPRGTHFITAVSH